MTRHCRFAVMAAAILWAVLACAPAQAVPFIQRGPRHQNVWVGETAVFDVAVTGTAPFFYQWQYYDRGTWRDIAGADEPALRVWRAQISDSGSRYRVIVTNAGGSVTSSVAYLGVSYREYDYDPWGGGFGYGCGTGTSAPLALIGLLLWRRRGSGGKGH